MTALPGRFERIKVSDGWIIFHLDREAGTPYAYTPPEYGRILHGSVGGDVIWGEMTWHTYRYRVEWSVEAGRHFAHQAGYRTDPELLAALGEYLSGLGNSQLDRLLTVCLIDLYGQAVTDICLVAADALRETGRGQEADLLVSGQPCHICQGRVAPASTVNSLTSKSAR